MPVTSNVAMWATAISTNVHNGRKIFFRYAKELKLTFDQASQPIRIIIVWRYESQTGQPVAEDHQRMNQFEDMLEAAVNRDSFATLALVSTGEGLREWTYYAQSEDEFMARLNYAFAGVPEFPIKIHTAYDPSWEPYEQFKAGVKDESLNAD